MHTTIIIGTGFSGLAMAIKLKEKNIHNFIILEKANEVGGTWRENTYPGAECDIPSALYSYSFEPYLKWEYKWSHQPQILDYLKYCAKKYDLYRHIIFGKEMTGATWREDGFWEIKTKDGEVYQSRTLVSAIGQLHHLSTPNFKGKEKFEGATWHSAKWNHEISLEGKKIGVIGNAASAIQFIPEIAKVAEKVTVFQRSANWMLPKLDRAYKNWEKKLVANVPFLLKTYRMRLWLSGGVLFFIMKKGNSWLRKFLQWQTKLYINRKIDNPDLRKKLIPNYPMGAKRVLFSDNYYSALNRKNVELITENIDQIFEKGVKTIDQKEHHFDLLIFATGFKTNPFYDRIEITGREDLSLKSAWQKGPKNYLGMTVSGFPNFFMMYGPNTNLGHNSIILMSEAQANYITQCVENLEKKELKSMDIKPQILEKYHQKIQQRLKNMIWASIDNSWYKSENGNIPNNYPGRTMEYMRVTKQVNFEDFSLM